MTQPKVFATRALPGGALSRLRAETDCEVYAGAGIPSPDELLRAASGCDGLLCLLTDRIDASLLGALPSLRVISSCSVGVDHIDLREASVRGIPVGHTPGVLVDTTAELAFGLLLAASRRLLEADAFVRQGGWTAARRWEPDMLLGRDLHGATLGIIGLGAIGLAVARRAEAFGMRVVGWTPSGRSHAGIATRELGALLGESDFVSVHVAFGDSTRNLLDAARIASMKPGAVLVNTARGGIVDEAALAEALVEGRIAAAALDVFGEEPLSQDSPLLRAPNTVLVPHIGSASIRTRSRMAELAVDNLLAALRGDEMPHCANAGAFLNRDSGAVSQD